MQRTMDRQRSLYRLVVVFGAGVVAALVLQPSHATAQWVDVAAAWSAPGSTGVADEASAP